MSSIPQESYGTLMLRYKAIQSEIEVARKQETEAALISIRHMVSMYGITEREIFGCRTLAGKRDNRFGKVAAKYRNPETGETWTGRGRPPRWISGKDYQPFLIARPSARQPQERREC
jgi:DNA-binding protein H-NS